jgi:electron-transferring-flavoprotein dehydrogenase
MSINPADFRPPVEKDEFITGIGDDPDNRLEAGVLFVGAGPASLAGAIRLSQLLADEPELMESLGEIPIAILEKGKYPGAHLLSGAVVNPIGFKTLFPEMKESDFPFFEKVNGEAVYYLTKKRSLRLPTPPTMHNKGNYVASISKIGEWLGQKAEEAGVMIFNEMAGDKLIIEEGAVKGVKTDD